MRRLSLPHPEIAQSFLDSIHIIDHVQHEVGDITVEYFLFTIETNEDPIGLYDEDGTIYISNTLTAISPAYADLVAYHETCEIEYKRNGAVHQEAHWTAYTDELEVAKRIFTDTDQLSNYISWRLSIYPESRIQNKIQLEEDILSLINQNMYPRQEIYKMVQSYGL